MHSKLTLFQIIIIGITIQCRPLNLFSQPNDPVYIEREELEDQYIRVDRKNYSTSPAYIYKDEMNSTYQVNVNEEGQNMRGDAANEPTIAIDPLDPMHMIIGWRQFDTIASNFREAGYAFTYDGGETWEFPGVIEQGVFRSDPVLDVDSYGRFYYNSLHIGSDLYHCEMFRTSNDQSWDGGTYAHGGDKQWMAIDRTSGLNNGNIYSFWQSDIGSCDGIFTCSYDHGDSYEDCTSLPVDMRFGTLAIGSSEEIYACGAGTNIQVCKATNITKSEPIVWDFKTSVDLEGTFRDHVGPNPGGLLGQIWIDTDYSSGPQHGNVYLLSTLSGADPADIKFSRSTDGGIHWSSPIKINDDEGLNWNWFGTMSVAPNGRIDVSWLDTRDNHNSHNSALYFSYSKDGGVTWSPNKKLSESFDPHVGYPNQDKIGDYFHMLSDDEGANLAWAATFNGEQDVYFSRILVEPLTSTNDFVNTTSLALLQNNPNPFNNTTYLSFTINKSGNVKLEIFDFAGHLVKVISDSFKDPGQYTLSWDGNDNKGQSVGNGLYIYKLSDEFNGVISKKMALIK